jgi:hypothetical protein
LYAIAGIAIPVIVHLWNNKRVKTLKIGSIRFLELTTGKQARSRTLSELLLLLLRCLLLIVLAVLLARPYWKQTTEAAKEKGWLLMEKKDLPETYSRFKPVIDSLLNKDYELHYFDPGFAKAELQDALKKDIISADTASSYRTLFHAADQYAATGIPFYIFSTNNITRFKGQRPVSSRTVHWEAYTKKDSIANWIQQARIGSTDSIYITAGRSRPTSTAYMHEVFPKAPQRGTEYEIGVNNGQLSAAMPGQSPISVDTATTRVAIYTDKYIRDSRYLRAAIEAIQQFSGHKMRLSITDSKHELPAKPDWLFWLSDQPAPLNNTALNVFVYAEEKGLTANSWIKTGEKANGEEEHIFISKLSAGSLADQAQVIWQDGFGKPVLTLENKSGNKVYRFFSHFDPAWNDLVWDHSFPSLLLDLILGEKPDDSEHDRRVIDQEQIKPVQMPGANNHNNNTYTSIDLTKACWLILFIIFIIERMISLGMLQYGKNR